MNYLPKVSRNLELGLISKPMSLTLYHQGFTNKVEFSDSAVRLKKFGNV